MRGQMTWRWMLPVLVLMTGCAGIPADAFKLSPSSLADRQMQSRRFETLDNKALIRAGLGVLQDLGYNIDEASTSLGVLTASKSADAETTGQIIGAVVLALLTGTVMETDDKQVIKVCLVLQPSLEDPNSSVARITMQRVIWNHSGNISRVESITAPELYQVFFDKLSKASFLEAHQI